MKQVSCLCILQRPRTSLDGQSQRAGSLKEVVSAADALHDDHAGVGDAFWLEFQKGIITNGWMVT